MPDISRVFGVVITMFYNDHAPPHFHAQYAERRDMIAIEDLALLRGGLPSRALALVVEWAARHRQGLLDNWALARARADLRPIEPLT